MPEGEGATAATALGGGGGTSPAASMPAQLLRLAAGPSPESSEESISEAPPDTGLLCLTLILRYFHEAADPDKLRHEYRSPREFIRDRVNRENLSGN